jgi:predicted DNA repair protein MutK
MAAGLAALLDDVAVLARAAAASVDGIGLAAGKASAKAAGVVVDDTAVTPRYVQGLAAERELRSSGGSPGLADQQAADHPCRQPWC